MPLLQGLGLTVKKWGATPARTGINNPANNWPHLLLLCTTRLGFGPGHEWLQALLQTGAYGAAGLAACPPAPLPFPVAVALRSLLQQVRCLQTWSVHGVGAGHGGILHSCRC